MADILVIDDENNVLSAFEKILRAEGHDVRTGGSGEEAIDQVGATEPDLVVMDIHLPGISGLETFKRLNGDHPHLPVIIMTAYGTTDTAIEATKIGAFDYHLKPFDPDEMLKTIKRALESGRLADESAGSRGESRYPGGHSMIGKSRPMQDVYKAIGRVAPTEATVLICGETGTGKELVGRAIHQHSRRADRPLVMVNCAAIPETLLEDELFGHEKGAYTGANSRRIGKFERADGGTIFLDEIGDMPLSTQVKILRTLQERSIERLGGSRSIPVDVRIIAATNRNLEKGISERRFREDLFHRLNGWTITVPPLREHRDDIPELADYFLTRFSRRDGVEKPMLSQKAVDILVKHTWPGNVRELEHCMNRALIFTCGFPIRGHDVQYVLKLGSESGSPTALKARQQRLTELVKEYLKTNAGENAHSYFMGVIDRLLVAEAVQMTGGNKTQGAKLLGISRPTLQAKLKKYSI